MMKKIVVLFCTAMLSVAMIGCGTEDGGNSQNSEPEGNQNSQTPESEQPVDINQLMEALTTGIKYTGAIAAIPQEDIGWYVDMEEGVTGTMYAVSGVSCEQVAIFTVPDKAAGDAMITNINDMLADQVEQNSAYDAKASQRVENAVLVQKDGYVILCVSDDSAKAQELIKDAFNE